jgi:hypothetical protein
MEILRFEDSTSPAPKRKKSSKGYITLGFVAAVFGIGSAFATTTVEINSGDGISLGQGVTLAAACDTDIDISPITEMRVVGDATPSPTFFLGKLVIEGVNPVLRAAATDSTPAVNGCGNQTFDVQIFNTAPTPTAYSCVELQPLGAGGGVVAIEIREGEVPVDTGITCTDSTISFQVNDFPSGNSRYDIDFDDAPSGISYITLVSRES